MLAYLLLVCNAISPVNYVEDNQKIVEINKIQNMFMYNASGSKLRNLRIGTAVLANVFAISLFVLCKSQDWIVKSLFIWLAKPDNACNISMNDNNNNSKTGLQKAICYESVNIILMLIFLYSTINILLAYKYPYRNNITKMIGNAYFLSTALCGMYMSAICIFMICIYACVDEKLYEIRDKSGKS